MSRYYENFEDAPKRRRPRKKRTRPSCLGAILRFFLKILCVLLVFALLLGTAAYFLPVSLFMVEPQEDLSLTTLPSSPFNVLVLGVDTQNEGMQRSDTMLIASISHERLQLTSIERDIMVEIPGYGRSKLNAAYSYGGPTLSMKLVNELFGLNVTKYVVVDFTVVVKVVDALGGVNITITQEEMEHINKNVLLSRKVFEPLGYTETALTQYGENIRLDGLRTLAYARIRKLDSDFRRMQRQRIVISAILTRLRNTLWNPVRIVAFVKSGLSGIQTNLSMVELVSLGEKVMLSKDFGELRLPVDGSFEDNGRQIEVTDLNANRQKVYDFLYVERENP